MAAGRTRGVDQPPPAGSPLDRGGGQRYTGGPIGLATELRNREKVLGTTIDSRRDLRIRYTEPASSPPAGVTNLDQYRDL